MKVVLNVSIEELENKINRQIIVDDNIKLTDLCEYIIVSMNGKKIPIYDLEYGNVTYYPIENLDTDVEDYEKSLVNLTLKDLNLKKNKYFYIEYDFDNFYNFVVKVDDIISIIETTYLNDICFEVISGKGYGLIDDETIGYLNAILNSTKKNIERYCTKSQKEYLEKKFDVNENNEKIKEYIEYRRELLKPKSYIFNVSLEGFGTQIKRKVCVNSNISIDSFCKKVIVSMNGDLSHAFNVKKNKEYLSEYYSDIELFYLGLSEKQRLKISYDWGDNWIFNITLSKIQDNFNKNEFEVISGKGYGIIDDCGGPWYLQDIFDGTNSEWGKYDINDFDLEKCNERVRKTW